MMRLAAACRKTSVSRTTGTAPESMMSANTCPGPTEGSWSISPTMSSAELSGVAFIRACINMTSTIEVSSTTSRSQSSGLSALRLNPPPLGSTSRSRWIVLASTPVASVIRLAARPVGAQSKSFTPLAARIRRIELTIVALPTPGPSVITIAFALSARRIASLWLSASCRRLRASTQGTALSGSIHAQGSRPFTIRISRSPIDCSARYKPARNVQAVSPGLADLVGDHVAFRQFQFNCGEDQFLRRFQQFFGERNQFVRWQPAVTLVRGLGQRIGNPGPQPDHCGFFDAELHRDRVGGLETDASDISGQPIGILGHNLDGVGAIGLVDANGTRGSNPVAMQEDHDLPDDLLLSPGVRDTFSADGADARHLAEPSRLGFDDVENLVRKRLDHLLGVNRANAPDHAGAQIFLNPFDRTRR